MLPILSALGSTTLTQLAYAVAIDTHKHFGRAAEACNVTQPTLSIQVGKLEASLGVVLFDRTRSPVLTTDIGKVLIEQARIILLEGARLADIRDQLRGSVVGELRVGIIPTLAPSILPRVIPALSKHYPDLRLTVLEEKTNDVVERLNNDSIDVGILGSDVTGTGVNAGAGMMEIPLFDEPFVGFISDSHRLFARSEIRARDLSLDDLWLLGEGHCFRAQAISLCSDGIDSKKDSSPYLVQSPQVAQEIRDTRDTQDTRDTRDTQDTRDIQNTGDSLDAQGIQDTLYTRDVRGIQEYGNGYERGNFSTRFEIGHLTTLVRLVEQGLGMTLLPALAAADLSQELQDKFVRKFADPVPYRTVRLVRRRTHYKDHLVGAMVEVLTHELPSDIVTIANQKI